MSIIEKKAAATPTSPPSGYVHWYVNASGQPEFVDEFGLVHSFIGATGPTGSQGVPPSAASAIKWGTD